LINHFGGYLFASMCLIVLKLVILCIFWFLQIWFVLFCVCVSVCALVQTVELFKYRTRDIGLTLLFA
jgi:hypothetical protein